VSERLWRQAFDLLCDGEQVLGRGMSRTVYGSKLLPDSVIKTEDVAQKFQNVIEWETWQRVVDTPLSRWFAECQWISSDGTVLIMERTRQPRADEFPPEVPHFLCDYKRKNYGMSTGKKGKQWFVCHDYGTLAFENSMASTALKRLRKVSWEDLEH